MVQNLREQRPSFNVVERESREGDRVTMDFEGLIDGKAFEGSKGDDVAVILGAGRMLKDFETGILGVKADEQKQIAVRYPDEYHNKDLAGQTAEFSVHVKKVEEKLLPPLDDAFCREYGVTEGGLEQLLAEVADNMRRELSRQRALAPEAAGVRPLPRGQPGRRAQRAGRAAGARHADRHGPPHGRQGSLAGPAGRAVRRAGAPPRGARHARQRAGQDAAESRSTARASKRASASWQRLIPIRMQSSAPTARTLMQCARSKAWCWRIRWWTILLERAKVTDQPSTFKELMNFGA